jgi:hypothetical protein
VPEEGGRGAEALARQHVHVGAPPCARQTPWPEHGLASPPGHEYWQASPDQPALPASPSGRGVRRGVVGGGGYGEERAVTVRPGGQRCHRPARMRGVCDGDDDSKAGPGRIRSLNRCGGGMWGVAPFSNTKKDGTRIRGGVLAVVMVGVSFQGSEREKGGWRIQWQLRRACLQMHVESAAHTP